MCSDLLVLSQLELVFSTQQQIFHLFVFFFPDLCQPVHQALHDSCFTPKYTLCVFQIRGLMKCLS